MSVCVIFDLDGTLFDTEKIHAQAESILVSKFGIIISPQEITKRYAGISTESYISELSKSELPVEEFMKMKKELMNEIVVREGLMLVEGIRYRLHRGCIQ